MVYNFNTQHITLLTITLFAIVMCSCSNSKSSTSDHAVMVTTYPSDVLPFLNEFRILNGDGSSSNALIGYEKENFFYTQKEANTNWVVYKTPNSGITSRTSSNTRTELGQIKHWTPKEGGKLTGTLKVMHVSTTGDARVAASYSVVVGQIHSDTGHENEPLKIFYKKFPGHKKGSLYWNYEINTQGENSGRWDFSTSVWGHDMSVIGTAPKVYPVEPKDGIELGETFSYEVNVYEGIMYLTFTSDDHATKTFTKSLITSEYINEADIPEQIRSLYAVINRDGTEQPDAYTGEMQYFKQGAYNQTNGKKPETNMVWSSGSKIYGGDLAKQYANGSYTEVWFKEATVGPGNSPPNE